MPQLALDTFRCVPLSCTLTPTSCGRRHETAPQHSACVGCEVGSAHAAGERPTHWPDGSPVMRLGSTPIATTPAPEGPKRHVWNLNPRKSPKKTEETMPRPAQLITYKGESLTGPEWAKRLGVSESTIYTRHKAGKALEPERAKPGAEKPRRCATKKAKAAPPADEADALRNVLCTIEPTDLLSRLGYQVEHLGRGPRGQLIHILDEAGT